MVASVGAALLGYIAGLRIQSPDDEAAEASALLPSLVTVAVERQVLRSDLVLRGDVRFDSERIVEVDGDQGDGSTLAVVTDSPLKTGDTLVEGSIVIEVGSRPVFALSGSFPMYRDLAPGLEGQDVKQLQEALVRLGFILEPSGRYDTRTGLAVSSWYEELGYVALSSTTVVEFDLASARSAVDLAAERLAQAEQAHSESEKLPTRSQVRAAQGDLEAAVAALDLAVVTRKASNASAKQAIANDMKAATQAESDLLVALTRVDAAAAGTHPDTNLPPTAEELLQLATVVRMAETSLDRATDAIANSTGEAEILLKQNELSVLTAETAVAVARSLVSELSTTPASLAETLAVRSAEKSLSERRSRLAEIEALIGPRVPREELLFFPEFPLRVQDVTLRKGDIAPGVAMTVAGSTLVVESSVLLSDRSLIEIGDLAVVDDGATNIDFTARITEIAEGPGGRVSDERISIRLSPTEPAAVELVGANLRVTLPIESTGGEVLTVPLAALVSTENGSVVIELEEPPRSGKTRRVTVVTGLSARGLIEIMAVGGQIDAGAYVVVGVNNVADKDDS